MLEDYLHQYFGFTSFRPGQKEIITSILEGQHTMAMLPTGTGKSLCYQLSGYLLEGQVLIVSPLLSLMQDQVEQMKMNGEKRVVAINSFLVGAERKKVFANLAQYKFILISPETLVFESMINILRKLNISLFVIDEAHCISQWGYDFRPDYLKLGDIREKLGNPLTLALTATATHDVVQDIIHSLGLHSCHQHLFSVDRPNIAIEVINTVGHLEKLTQISKIIESYQGPGIIYFSSKKRAEEVAEYLKNKGYSRVMAYHGGMDQETRILIQQQFIFGQLDLICATSAFGMGINKENIRYVIHYHMPQQLESYLQEMGRAGRDGYPSIAILLYSVGDEAIAYQLAESEIPSDAQLDWLQFSIDHQSMEIRRDLTTQEDLRRIGGFTEVQWRIVSDYLLREDGSPKEILLKLKKSLEKRRILKRKKIAYMTNWCRTDNCRRNEILGYFKEEMKGQKLENCCDVCGIEHQRYLKGIRDENNFVDFSWKDRLAKLLLNK